MRCDTNSGCVYQVPQERNYREEGNARRRTTDADIVTLAVAQAIVGEPSDRRFLRRATRYAGGEFAAAVNELTDHARVA